MTSDFTPSDREHEAVDPFVGDFSSEFASPDVSDHWIDEALRMVPLPDGFLTRMSLLAQSAPPPVRSGHLA